MVLRFLHATALLLLLLPLGAVASDYAVAGPAPTGQIDQTLDSATPFHVGQPTVGTQRLPVQTDPGPGPGPETPLDAPWLLRASYTPSGAARLAWAEPLVGDPSHYRVYRNTDGAWDLVGTSVSTEFLDAPPSGDGLLVRYRVTAVYPGAGGGHESEPSNEAFLLSCPVFALFVGSPPEYDLWLHPAPLSCLPRDGEVLKGSGVVGSVLQ